MIHTQEITSGQAINTAQSCGGSCGLCVRTTLEYFLFMIGFQLLAATIHISKGSAAPGTSHVILAASFRTSHVISAAVEKHVDPPLRANIDSNNPANMHGKTLTTYTPTIPQHIH